MAHELEQAIDDVLFAIQVVKNQRLEIKSSYADSPVSFVIHSDDWDSLMNAGKALASFTGFQKVGRK